MRYSHLLVSALVLPGLCWASLATASEQLELEPAYQERTPGETATIQGSLRDAQGEPLAEKLIEIEIVSGPHGGEVAQLATDSEGQFSFSYLGETTGLDLVTAIFESDDDGGAPPPPPIVLSSARTASIQNIVSATAEVEWTEEELAAPDCNTVVASPFLIWPPNHRMRAVTLHGPDAVDGVEAELEVLYVHQDEPTNYLGDGNFDPDGWISEDGSEVSVRAERSGLLDGRLYFVGFEASLPGGGSCEGEAVLGVPHDRGQGSLPQDSGERYDSLTGEDLSED